MNHNRTLRAVLVSACLALAACGADDILPADPGESAAPSQPPPGSVIPAPGAGAGPFPVPGDPVNPPVGPIDPVNPPIAPVNPPIAPIDPPIDPPVDPVDPPPPPIELVGTPGPDATVGTAWQFQPTVVNGNGTLNWKVDNQPSWTNFDPKTGKLQGVPAEEHVGAYDGVAISVTNGVGTATGAEFSITVNARNGATGSAELSWTPPSQRTDGKPVGKLSGYRILYGTSSGQYDQFVKIDNPGVTQYLVEHLAPGTWYFAVTAITADRLESKPSKEVNKKFGG